MPAEWDSCCRTCSAMRYPMALPVNRFASLPKALTAVSVACLTIYDMIKAVERGVRIDGIHLVEKIGGKSGHYRAAR